MKRLMTAGLASVFFVYALFILAQYSLHLTELTPLAWFAGFLFASGLSGLVFILVLAAAAYGIGGLLFSRILPGFGSLLEEGMFKAGLGLAVISYAVFLLGLAGLLYPATGYVLLAACLAAGWKGLYSLAQRLGALPLEIRPTAAGTLALAAAAFVLYGGFREALMPPTGFDVLMYHLGVPNLYIEAHRIFPTPDINGSSYPFGAEMLYLLAMLVDGEVAANLVNYSFAAGGGLVAYAFARRFTSLPSHPMLAAAMFLTLPIVGWLLPQAYIEFAQGFYICLAVYALIASVSEKGDRWLYVSAVLVGFAMCIKYTSNLMFFVVVLGVLYRKYYIERAGAKAAAVFTLKFSVLAVLVVMPWYVKNLAYYGNPFYPMLAASSGGTGDLAVYYEEGMKVGPLHFLTVAWRVTMEPRGFYVGEANSLGPYFLMFIPGLLLVRGMGREVKLLMAYCLAYVAVWFLTGQNIRYLVPAGPFLAVLAAYPIARLSGEGGALKAAGLALAALFSFSAIYANSDHAAARGYYAADPAGRDRYYTEKSMTQGFLSSYGTWKWINANLPEDAVIYQLWDDASVYFRERRTLGFPSTLGATGRDKVIYIRGHNSFGGFRPGEEILANLKAMGAQFLLINANREGRTIPEDPYFVANTRLIKADNGIFLYQIP
ncbi:MAG: glycosyltransferase family 39 protein [Nitrospirae bacterium]|nr:glycosyltransferase family 39 protein [Nitrospirota bacterium]